MSVSCQRHWYEVLKIWLFGCKLSITRVKRVNQEGLMSVWKPFLCSQVCEEGVLIWGGNPDDAAAADDK